MSMFPVEHHLSGRYDSIEFRRKNITQLRTSTSFELELTEPGEAVAVINGEEYPHDGRLLFAHPGDNRFTRGKFCCEYLHFSAEPEFAEKYLNMIPRSVTECDRRKYRTLFSAVNAAQNDELGQTAAMLALISQLVNDSSGSSSTAGVTPEVKRGIDRAKGYIDSHYSEKLSLELIAKNAGFSRTYFHNMFRLCEKITPHAYLMNVRLDRAKELLTTTLQPIAQIAEECGFDSQQYMNFVFSREIGVTPAAYRREHLIVL